MKRIHWLICVTAMSLLAVACDDSDHVGGIYKSNDWVGIVLSVDDDNSPVLVMSVDEAVCIDADSAARWAAAYGDGSWRLPTSDEAQSIEENRYLINSQISKRGYKLLGDENYFYWTGTECSQTHVYALGPNGIRCYFRTNASGSYRARAVRSLLRQEDDKEIHNNKR